MKPKKVPINPTEYVAIVTKKPIVIDPKSSKRKIQRVKKTVCIDNPPVGFKCVNDISTKHKLILCGLQCFVDHTSQRPNNI